MRGIDDNEVEGNLEVYSGQMGLTMYYGYQTWLCEPSMQA